MHKKNGLLLASIAILLAGCNNAKSDYSETQSVIDKGETVLSTEEIQTTSEATALTTSELVVKETTTVVEKTSVSETTTVVEKTSVGETTIIAEENNENEIIDLKDYFDDMDMFAAYIGHGIKESYDCSWADKVVSIETDGILGSWYVTDGVISVGLEVNNRNDIKIYDIETGNDISTIKEKLSKYGICYLGEKQFDDILDRYVVFAVITDNYGRNVTIEFYLDGDTISGFYVNNSFAEEENCRELLKMCEISEKCSGWKKSYLELIINNFGEFEHYIYYGYVKNDNHYYAIVNLDDDEIPELIEYTASEYLSHYNGNGMDGIKIYKWENGGVNIEIDHDTMLHYVMYSEGRNMICLGGCGYNISQESEEFILAKENGQWETILDGEHAELYGNGKYYWRMRSGKTEFEGRDFEEIYNSLMPDGKSIVEYSFESVEFAGYLFEK